MEYDLEKGIKMAGKPALLLEEEEKKEEAEVAEEDFLWLGE